MKHIKLLIKMENIEKKSNYRLAMFPIKYRQLWNFYKKAESVFWSDDQINVELVKDIKNWQKLEPKVQHFIKHILAFFASSDAIVNETIGEQIIKRIQLREAKLWYNFQEMMENVHNIVYSKLIDTYISNKKEKMKILQAQLYIPTIKKKIDWIHKWVGHNNDMQNIDKESRMVINDLLKLYFDVSKHYTKTINKNILNFRDKLLNPAPSLAKLLFINIINEGVFFSGSFCSIFWLDHTYKGLLPGLKKSNEYISRDEGLHVKFGIYIYNNFIENKLLENEVHLIINEAVLIESDFICHMLPSGLKGGMNSKSMLKYIKFVADQLLEQLNYKKLYNVKNPFDFMEQQSVGVRIVDFFEDHPSEYKLANSNTSLNDLQLDFGDNF